MATTRIDELEAWKSARNALFADQASTWEFLQGVDYSGDEESEYQQARGVLDRIARDLRRLGLKGLELVDQAIARSELVESITELAKEAEREAARIKKASKTLDGITKAVDLATTVVTKVVGLPTPGA